MKTPIPEVDPKDGKLIGIFAFRRKGKPPQVEAFFQQTCTDGTFIFTVENGRRISWGIGHDLKAAMKDVGLKESDRRES